MLEIIISICLNKATAQDKRMTSMFGADMAWWGNRCIRRGYQFVLHGNWSQWWVQVLTSQICSWISRFQQFFTLLLVFRNFTPIHRDTSIPSRGMSSNLIMWILLIAFKLQLHECKYRSFPMLSFYRKSLLIAITEGISIELLWMLKLGMRIFSRENSNMVVLEGENHSIRATQMCSQYNMYNE